MIDMKILVFTGGLGNQIFGYAFYCWIKDKFPQQNFMEYIIIKNCQNIMVLRLINGLMLFFLNRIGKLLS